MFNEENASDLELSRFQPVLPLSPGLSRELQVFLAGPTSRNLTRDGSRTFAFPRPHFDSRLPSVSPGPRSNLPFFNSLLGFRMDGC